MLKQIETEETIFFCDIFIIGSISIKGHLNVIVGGPFKLVGKN